MAASSLFGLLSKRERWFLSRRGAIATLVLFVLLGIFAGRRLHPFLAHSAPVQAKVLVVEGWMPSWGMIQVANEFARQDYTHVLIVRPVLDANADYDPSWSAAKHTAAALAKNGVPSERITKLFSLSVRRDRTFSSALTVKEWLNTNNISPIGINVATVGPHARRSGILYQKAIPTIPVGTIAVEPRAYNPSKWWRYSEGVRETVGELIAFIYARFVFEPADEQ